MSEPAVGAEPHRSEDHPPLNRTARFAWGAVAVILALVIALIVYVLTGNSATRQTDRRAITSPAVLNAVTHVPPSVFDLVGVSAPNSGLVAPHLLAAGSPPLLAVGKPDVLYVGAEYCSFCAAERWALVVALSRFGHFDVLHDMQSADNAVFAATQTFSFVRASYVSPYVAFTGVEVYSDELGPDGSYTKIATLSPVQQGAVAAFGPQRAGEPTDHPFPFVDIGNRLATSTAGFSPAMLVKLSRLQIATQLSDPTAPAGRAVIAAANLLSAGICAATGQQPATVCTSPGVAEANKALGLH